MPASAIKPALLQELLTRARAEEEAPISEQTPTSGVFVIDRDDRYIGSSGQRAFLDDPIDADTVRRLFATNARAHQSYAQYQQSIGAYRANDANAVDHLIDAFYSLLDTAEILGGIQVYRRGQMSEDLAFKALQAGLALYTRCDEMCNEALTLLDQVENARIGDNRPWELEQIQSKEVLPAVDSFTELLKKKNSGRGGNNSGNATPGGGYVPPALTGGGMAAAAAMSSAMLMMSSIPVAL
jgi:hypothetical protein